MRLVALPRRFCRVAQAASSSGSPRVNSGAARAGCPRPSDCDRCQGSAAFLGRQREGHRSLCHPLLPPCALPLFPADVSPAFRVVRGQPGALLRCGVPVAHLRDALASSVRGVPRALLNHSPPPPLRLSAAAAARRRPFPFFQQLSPLSPRFLGHSGISPLPGDSWTCSFSVFFSVKARSHLRQKRRDFCRNDKNWSRPNDKSDRPGDQSDRNRIASIAPVASVNGP